LENTSGDLSNATSNPAAGATSIPPIEKWGLLDHESVEDIISKGKRPSDPAVGHRYSCAWKACYQMENHREVSMEDDNQAEPS
jgi:hypothetical protein